MPTPLIRRAIFLLLTIVFAAGPVSAVDTMAQSAAPSGSGQSAPSRPQLSITMQQAVEMSLEANLGLTADKLSPQIQEQSLVASRAFYTPVALLSGSRQTSVSVSTSFLDQSAATLNTAQTGFSAGVAQQLRWYGGNYSVTFGGNRGVNSAAGNTFNPLLRSTLSVGFFQPLLRNFKTDSARTALKTNTIQRQITDTLLLERIATTERDARLQYLNLIGAIEGRKVAQTNLEVARDSLRGNRARVDVGLTAPIDIVDAEANVLAREDSVILADGQIERAMDQLRQVILNPSRPDYWTVQFVPTETIQAEPRTIDVDAAVKAALENRSDLVAARKNLDIQRATVDLAHNQTMPNVDFRLNYTGTGTAGTQIKYAPGSATEVVATSSQGFGSAIGDAFGYVQPAWSYGVQVSYPIGQSDTKANYTRSQLLVRQAEIQLREGELAVVTQVRDAARQVDTNFKRVQTSRASLEAQEKRLAAEQKRFDVGTSDTFHLFLIQSDVAAARVTELQARLAYTQAIIAFDAVQRIR